MDGYEYCANLLKALAHPVRLRILDALSADLQACVCHLERLLQLRQPYISQQLAILREAGLVQDRREGMNVYYALASPLIADGLHDQRTLFLQMAKLQDEVLLFPPIDHDPDEPCPCPRCHEQVEIKEPIRA
jgi:ArsR family transcriptional regulator